MASNILIKCLYNVGRIAYAGCLLNVVTNYIAEPTLVRNLNLQFKDLLVPLRHGRANL